MFRKFLKIPVNIRKILTNYKILSFDFGQWGSIKTRMCFDAEGRPIPWYTYPAIEYLKQLDMRDKAVFEFGSGNSSLFWSDRAKEVLSVEIRTLWYEMVDRDDRRNLEILFAPYKDEYVNSIVKVNREFDVIIVDGSFRFDCAKVAVNYLKDGGMIILDNSDWHPKTSEFLRSRNLIEVDFSGFGPINGYTWTTSLFLSRDFAFKPLCGVQPVHSIGSLKQNCDVERDN